MKKILLFWGLLVLLVSQGWTYGIISNVGSTSEDSICVNVFCPDSLGRPVKCDSFYVVIFKSGTNAVVFRDSGLIGMTGMDSTIIGGRTAYYYHRATADIDGDGLAGQYTGQVVSVTVTANLPFITPFTFQVVSLELDDQLTEIANILDTLQVYDDANGFQTDVQDILDTLRVYDAAGHLLANVQAILDTLQVYDAAGHLLANVQAILDSIKLYDVTGRFSVNVSSMNPEVIGANQIATNAIGALELALSAAQEIAHVNYDTMLIHATDFQGSSSFPDSSAGDLSDLANHKVGVYVDSTKDDYINDIKIADDAFVYGMFAASAPTAWWNEGKTGYRLSSTGDQSVADRVLVTGIDSLNKAIADANKGNFMRWTAVQRDSILNTMVDANKANYMATGFATSADGDSVTQAIADANKENFKYAGGDSVRSYLATHDSTLLEQAAATGGSGSELCSLLLIDSNSNAVSGLTWTVKDSAGNDLGIANTNAAGWATFNIDQHDSVHAYPTERAGISLATYYAEPVPSGGFCDTITATIWNYTVAGGGMCNLHINTRDLKRRSTGYGRWKMTVEYSKPGGYTDTTGGFLQWGGMEETAFKDSGLLQISVPQTYRALLYDSVTDTYTDSGLVNIRIYREDNLIREIFKVNVPRDSTQYDVLRLMMK